MARTPTRRQSAYWGKKAAEVTDAATAVSVIKSGQRVLVQGGHATSVLLLQALVDRAKSLTGVEIMHLHSEAEHPHLAPGLEKHLRHNALFAGTLAREAINADRADYTPAFLSDVPDLIRNGRLRVDVAMIQVSPPDSHGFCTLGPSVDIARAAVDTAAVVLAEVNPRIPRTHGDSHVHLSAIDKVVHSDHALPAARTVRPLPVAAQIGELVASLVEDGSTIQFGIGAVPTAVLASFKNKHHLGVHSELITDALIDLVEGGVVTGRCKTLDPGVVLASFAIGSDRLMRFIDDNPMVHLVGSDITNRPDIIRKQDKMIAINSAIEVDLTGQVCSESIGPYLYSGVGGQVDFLRGAALSKGGKAIIAMPSTARGGTCSRITPALSPGAAVTTSRSHVHYVVTEYGIADLFGRSLREREEALIAIAHPDFREDLRRWTKSGKSIFGPGLAAASLPAP